MSQHVDPAEFDELVHDLEEFADNVGTAPLGQVMAPEINDVASLESTVGSPPLAALMKSIVQLDAHCVAVLERSTAAVIAWRSRTGAMRSTLVGGDPGFVEVASGSRLSLPVPDEAIVGDSVGLVFLTPGWIETLRVNGRIVDGGVEVTEALIHCGKAMIRSAFWSTTAGPAADGPASRGDRIDKAQREFLGCATFVAIGSCDGTGAADVSPKGDPAGFVQVLDGVTVAIPDRPGNRRTDTLHNVLESPEVSLLALVPGDDRTLEITGLARITTHPDVLGPMAVKGNVPKVALLVDVRSTELSQSAAIVAAELWDDRHHVAEGELPRAARMWTDHVKQSDAAGVAARLIRTAANEAVVHAGVQQDYQRNLY